MGFWRSGLVSLKSAASPPTPSQATTSPESSDWWRMKRWSTDKEYQLSCTKWQATSLPIGGGWSGDQQVRNTMHTATSHESSDWWRVKRWSTGKEYHAYSDRRWVFWLVEDETFWQIRNTTHTARSDETFSWWKMKWLLTCKEHHAHIHKLQVFWPVEDAVAIDR